MFVKPFVMSYLLQEHLRLICQKTSFSMFALMGDGTRFSKNNNNVSELKCFLIFFFNCFIDKCHGVSLKLHPG